MPEPNSEESTFVHNLITGSIADSEPAGVAGRTAADAFDSAFGAAPDWPSTAIVPRPVRSYF